MKAIRIKLTKLNRADTSSGNVKLLFICTAATFLSLFTTVSCDSPASHSFYDVAWEQLRRGDPATIDLAVQDVYDLGIGLNNDFYTNLSQSDMAVEDIARLLQEHVYTTRWADQILALKENLTFISTATAWPPDKPIRAEHLPAHKALMNLVDHIRVELDTVRDKLGAAEADRRFKYIEAYCDVYSGHLGYDCECRLLSLALANPSAFSKNMRKSPQRFEQFLKRLPAVCFSTSDSSFVTALENRRDLFVGNLKLATVTMNTSPHLNRLVSLLDSMEIRLID